MNKHLIVIFLGCVLIINNSCNQRSTDLDMQSNISFSYYSSKCLQKGLMPKTDVDSIFTYSFTTSLILDFSVQANCCPDSNRFFISHSVVSDTITVLVSDTAGNNCRCICPYIVHTEFKNLPGDHYIICC